MVSQAKIFCPSIIKVPAIPKQLKKIHSAVLHGELFARLDRCDSTASGYSSARHFVVAQINRLKLDVQALSQLDFFPWLWVNAPYETDCEALNALACEGFRWPQECTCSVESFAAIQDGRHRFHQPDKPLPFLLDGIVIKLDNLKARADWGESQIAPQWALAWKFPSLAAVSVIKDITFTVGRTGHIAPVAEIERVQLGGVTVSSLSLGSPGNDAK